MELGSLLLDFISYMSQFYLSMFSVSYKPKFPMDMERQSHAHSLLIPAWPYKNRLWVWNMSLLRHKDPTHLVLGLWPCVGMLNECSFILLKCVCQYPTGTHPTFSILHSKGRGQGTRGLCIGCLGERLAMGDRLPLLRLILLSFFSTHILVKHCSIQFLCLHCVFLGNSDVKM